MLKNMSNNPSHINHIALGPSLRTSVKDRFRSEQLGDGWMQHVVPHNGDTYLHNPSLNLIMLDDLELKNPSDRNKFVSCHGLGPQALETFVRCVNGELEFVEINHAEEMAQVRTKVDNDIELEDGRRARYWIYISHFPCHYELPSQAKSEALFILELMELQILAKPSDLPRTPFSASEINDYTKFLQPSETKTSNIRFAETIVIAHILANYYSHQYATAAYKKPLTTSRKRFRQNLLKILCFGMPPNHSKRFEQASRVYLQTLQSSQWKYFVDEVKGERAAANVMSGLLLASSVAFLAIPNLVDISQNFILLSMGLSLSAVVMGFNAKLEEKLLALQDVLIQNPNDGTEKLILLAHIMEQHYTTVLLSVLCFFISVLVFTAYEVYSSVFVQKFFTVPYLFFLVATCGLIGTAVATIRWNRLVSSPSVDSNV